ncbi:DUF995 domain-containing protein [Ruegeria profundi]|uniref:DUF995 domain-containing protein n=1 Tax=Ruegeria profundi TaxID=1685378 RepID=UPI001CD77BAF|nr:DUF995 domain-containing protein [Ruegeria profundi]
MFLRVLLVNAAVVTVLAHGIAWADPKPRGAKAADPNRVVELYRGKTQIWNVCGGGLYYGTNGQASAWCRKHKHIVALGTWRVDRNARVCREIIWHWPEGESIRSKSDGVVCIEHVVAPDGSIWRSWPDESEWWSMSGDRGLLKGDRFKSQKKRRARKMGLKL